MGFSLIPREEKFFRLFEEQAAYNVEAARVFRDLVAEWNLESPAFDRLRDLEHEADITTHEIKDRLNRTFITPFDREDIHRLCSELDDVVDLIESIAFRMRVYRLSRTTEDLAQLADVLWQATEAVRKAVRELRIPEKKRRLLDHCIEVNRLENAGDQVLGTALGRLFHGSPDPIQVIQWKEIYEVTETAIDRCEDVANTLESIVVKQG
jgi:hypothetical protein